MPGYALNVRPRARRALRQLDPATRQVIAAAIDALAADPRPPGTTAIKGHRPYLRIRVGDYRVIYAVDDTAHAVQVAVVGHRRQVYRNLDL